MSSAAIVIGALRVNICIISCEPVFGFLSNFLRIYNWDITKNWLDFSDLDLIFKVTAVEKLKIHGGCTSVFSKNPVTIFSYYYLFLKWGQAIFIYSQMNTFHSSILRDGFNRNDGAHFHGKIRTLVSLLPYNCCLSQGTLERSVRRTFWHAPKED